MKIFRLLLPYSLAVLLALAGASRTHAEPTSNDPKARAAAALEQDVKTDPNNPELWLHLGFAYRKDGQINQAETAFEKTASLDPHNEDAFYMLGLIYESKHQTAEAKKAWQSYLSIEKDANKRSIAEKHIHRLTE